LLEFSVFAFSWMLATEKILNIDFFQAKKLFLKSSELSFLWNIF